MHAFQCADVDGHVQIAPFTACLHALCSICTWIGWLQCAGVEVKGCVHWHSLACADVELLPDTSLLSEK